MHTAGMRLRRNALAMRASPAHIWPPSQNGQLECQEGSGLYPAAQPRRQDTFGRPINAGCLLRLSNPGRKAAFRFGLSSLIVGGRGSRRETHSPARFPCCQTNRRKHRFQPFSRLPDAENQPRCSAATSARGTPERSGTMRRTAIPADSKIALTASPCPSPSSITAWPVCVKTSGMAVPSAR